MIRSRINASNQFPELTRDIEQRVRRALDEAAEDAAKAARAAGSSRGTTDIEVVPAHGTEDGYASGIRGRWYYRFQSTGTLGNNPNAKRPGKKRSHAPGTGIVPNRMFEQARTAGRKKLRALIARL